MNTTNDAIELGARLGVEMFYSALKELKLVLDKRVVETTGNDVYQAYFNLIINFMMSSMNQLKKMSTEEDYKRVLGKFTMILNEYLAEAHRNKLH